MIRLLKEQEETQPADGQRATTFDLQLVANPPALYHSAPLWSWNEVLEEQEVRRQVRELAQGGFGGAFMHVRLGLITPYQGEEFYTAIQVALDEARSLGLQMYLYDEDRWPSGWAGGAVPRRDPNFRTKWLLRIPSGQDVPPDSDVSLLAADVDGTRYYRLLSPMGLAWFSGTTYADLLHEQAMQAFIEEAYAPYAQRFGRDFGGLIPAIFTDEPSMTILPSYAENIPGGLLFWTDALPERFYQQHGYDLLPHLQELFEDVGDFTATRTDYYRTCAWLFEHHFVRQVSDWCRDHQIALTGHFMEEGYLPGSLAWSGSTLPLYRFMDWPGIDHLGLQIQEVITALGCRSVVNQYQKERMTSELFGCAGQHLTFADRKWIAEQQIVLGVNFMAPHLLLYTMAGERKRDYPCNLWYQQPWWPLNEYIETYLARLCALMSQGSMQAEFLVLHPQESLYPLRRPPSPDSENVWAPFHHADKARMEEIEDTFQKLSRVLLAYQRQFDYGDETILAEIGRVECNGERALLYVGAMAYPLVILPALSSVRGTTLTLLEAFVEAGGRVLATGNLPTLVDGRKQEAPRLHSFLQQVEVVALDDITTVLQEILPALVQAEVRGPKEWLWQQTRLVGTQHITLLVNLSRHEEIEGTIHFADIHGPVVQLDLVQQTQHTLAEASGRSAYIDIHLAPGESLVLLFGSDDDETFVRQQELPTDLCVAQHLAHWEVERLDENALVLDYASFCRAGEEWNVVVPVLAIQHVLNAERYDGPLTLRYTFHCTKDASVPRALQLVLEHPERCTITINGQVVTYTDLPFWRDIRWLPVEIGAYVQPGENMLELSYPDFAYGDVTSVHDQARRYGTEIEAIYLIGDFAVEIQAVPPIPSQAPLEPALPWRLQGVEQPVINATRALQTGNLVEQGLPFYTGRVAYRTRVTLPAAPRGRVWLACEEMSVPVVEVRVNGERAGALTWQPYRIECGSLLQEGENTIELIFYHSLRNLLGPHHNAAGETAWSGLPMLLVGPHSFLPQQPGWAKHMLAGEWESVEEWRHSYAVTPFGLEGEVRLLVARE